MCSDSLSMEREETLDRCFCAWTKAAVLSLKELPFVPWGSDSLRIYPSSVVYPFRVAAILRVPNKVSSRSRSSRSYTYWVVQSHRYQMSQIQSSWIKHAKYVSNVCADRTWDGREGSQIVWDNVKSSPCDRKASLNWILILFGFPVSGVVCVVNLGLCHNIQDPDLLCSPWRALFFSLESWDFKYFAHSDYFYIVPFAT